MTRDTKSISSIHNIDVCVIGRQQRERGPMDELKSALVRYIKSHGGKAAKQVLDAVLFEIEQEAVQRLREKILLESATQDDHEHF